MRRLAGGLLLACLHVVPATAQTSETGSLALPAPDSALQAGLDEILASARFRRAASTGHLSVVLIDITDREHLRLAAHDEDRMQYAASLPKIAIMLGVFHQVQKGALEYTPALREKMERMIRDSDNRISSELITLVGFENIAATLRDPRWDLYDPEREGGLWVGRGYGGGVGLWQRDPIHGISHGATARQAARFLLLMDMGLLVSPWASAEMKSIMGSPRIRHKFVRGLLNVRPLSKIFRKSGTFKDWHADAAIVERGGRRYIAVALLESPNHDGVLADLIARLDRLVMPSPETAETSEVEEISPLL